jgi:AcrR family transcriptional regulator
MKKSEATRERVFDTALQLFRKSGFQATTMRQIAEGAGLAVGAAYYYFPTKEAILLELYRRNHVRFGELADAALADVTGVPSRLVAVLRAACETVRRDRKLMQPMFGVLADPTNPISVLAPETREMREHSMVLLLRAIEELPLPKTVRPLAGQLLLLVHFAVLLYFVNDRSRGQAKTATLIDNVTALLVPLLGLVGTPFGAPLVAQVQRLLADADLDTLLA